MIPLPAAGLRASPDPLDYIGGPSFLVNPQIALASEPNRTFHGSACDGARLAREYMGTCSPNCSCT